MYAVNKMIADYGTEENKEDGVYCDVHRMLLIEKESVVKDNHVYELYVKRLFHVDQTMIDHMYISSLTLGEMHKIVK